MTITKHTEWEGAHARLVTLGGLPKGPGAYRVIPGRKVTACVVHQSAGNELVGLAAPVRIAQFHTAQPKYKTDANGRVAHRRVRGAMRPWWIGGGRGWPGIGYTFVVPAVPEVVGGKFEVYRCHSDDVRSYHTNTMYNTHGVAVVVAGTYASRHARNARALPAPHPEAMAALEDLVLSYLVPRYGLDVADGGLVGHFDAGKPACPGDALEQWVREQRGEDVRIQADDPTVPLTIDARRLDSVQERQQALLDLGYDLGRWGADGKWGEASKAALMAFQGAAGLVPDGLWGPKTARAVQEALP